MYTRLTIRLAGILALLIACTPGSPTDAIDAGTDPAGDSDSNAALRNELEPILRAMLVGPTTEQLELIQYADLACANVDALGGPPPCPVGVPEGTVLQVLPMLGSEGTFATSQEMEQILTNLSLNDLYAVYRVLPGPNDDSNYPVGEYAMIFERETNDPLVSLVLRVLDGMIVRMDFPMGRTLAELFEEIPAEQILITPAEAASWSEEVRATPAGAP